MNDQEWDYGALAIEVSAAKAEIEQLKALLARAADALEADNPHWSGQHIPLIAELRKAATE